MAIKADDKGMLKPMPGPRFISFGPQASPFWQTVEGLFWVVAILGWGVGMFLIVWHAR